MPILHSCAFLAEWTHDHQRDRFRKSWRVPQSPGWVILGAFVAARPLQPPHRPKGGGRNVPQRASAAAKNPNPNRAKVKPQGTSVAAKQQRRVKVQLLPKVVEPHKVAVQPKLVPHHKLRCSCCDAPRLSDGTVGLRSMRIRSNSFERCAGVDQETNEVLFTRTIRVLRCLAHQAHDGFGDRRAI